MSEILISKNNSDLIINLINNPSHSIILVGPQGYGKLTLAKYVAKNILKIKEAVNIINYPYINVISPINNNISIDIIREMKKLFNLKTTGRNNIRRLVIIENADIMNDESQNALLKILEEPPKDSVIIMTAKNERNLRPTVLSRSTIIKLKKPNFDEVHNYFNNDIEKTKKIYLYSKGSIGTISKTLDNSNDMINVIDQAKYLLRSSLLERILSIDKLIRDKYVISETLNSLKQISKAAFYQSLSKDQQTKTNYWLNNLRVIQRSEEDLAKGANPKLLLLNMFIHM